MDEIYDSIVELHHRAFSAEFADEVTRDIVCELCTAVRLLASELRRTQEAAHYAANAASCMANGMRPD